MELLGQEEEAEAKSESKPLINEEELRMIFVKMSTQVSDTVGTSLGEERASWTACPATP